MKRFNERYIVDASGHRVSVILDWGDYQQLLEEVEELACLAAYDAAKADQGKAIPWIQALAENENELIKA